MDKITLKQLSQVASSGYEFYVESDSDNYNVMRHETGYKKYLQITEHDIDKYGDYIVSFLDSDDFTDTIEIYANKP